MKWRNMASVYLTRGDEVLLLYRQGGRVVNETWVASAGGHFEKDELNDPRACMLRELREELGLTAEDISEPKLCYVCLRRTKGEVRQNYYYFSELRTDRTLTSDEGTLKWVPRKALSDYPMPYSAEHMIRHWLNNGCRTDTLWTGVSDGETVRFLPTPET